MLVTGATDIYTWDAFKLDGYTMWALFNLFKIALFICVATRSLKRLAIWIGPLVRNLHTNIYDVSLTGMH